MARKKKETEIMVEDEEATICYAEEPCLTLAPGFYFLDENRNLKTKQVTRGKPGEQRQIVTEPICVRTIGAAKDVAAVAETPLAILCVHGQNMAWPV